MDNVKKDSTKPKADMYASLQDSTQTFGGIGILEAVNGDIVLRGRNGQRDVIFPLSKAVEKYHDTQLTVAHYCRYGIRGWDTLADIAKDFRVRILEACEQRRKLHITIPKSVLDFEQQESGKGANS